jgi:hypothetical protein
MKFMRALMPGAAAMALLGVLPIDAALGGSPLQIGTPGLPKDEGSPPAKSTPGGASSTECDEQWLPALPGPSSHVFAFTVAAVDNGPSLYAGGAFVSASGQTVNYVARWNGPGAGWSGLGGGVYDDVIPWVYALAGYGGDLIAGGQFTEAGGVPTSRVARWNGSFWQPLGPGVNGAVWTLVVHEGDLYAGGYFTQAGGVAANRVARWDGTQWTPLGSGMNGPVFVLGVYDGGLIAGGDFTAAGGAPASRIARWDGEQWHPLGDGLNHWARAMVVHDGKLIVGGRFTTAGGEPASYVAEWDGASGTWSPIGGGISGGFIPPGVEALALHNGNIVAGGNFTLAEGEPASRIARWNGRQWLPLGKGANSTVWALTEYAGHLHAGGYMTSAGGIPVPYWARWTIDGQPAITAQPQHADAPAGSSVSFSVGVDGAELSYQWRREGVALEDDDRISGSHSPSLVIDPVQLDDVGEYDALVHSACGTAISAAAALTVSANPADLNGDGIVDVLDLLILLDSWGACNDCDGCPADFNGDCSVDVLDLLFLLDNWG